MQLNDGPEMYRLLGNDWLLDLLIGSKSASCKFCSQPATHESLYGDQGASAIRHCANHEKMAAQLVAKAGSRVTEVRKIGEGKALPKTETCGMDGCSNQATKRVIWADGRAYQPVCDDHVQAMKDHLNEKNNDAEIVGVRDIPKALAAPSPDPHATKLREYWVHGEGAAKIRWGQPGDFNRCVRHMRKFVGVRAEGLCNVYHGVALGAAPGNAPGERRGKSEVARRAMEMKSTTATMPDEGTNERTTAAGSAAARAASGRPAASRQSRQQQRSSGSSQNSNSDFNSKHPRGVGGRFTFKNDSGQGSAKQGTKDSAAKDGKVTGRISAAQEILVKQGFLKSNAGHNGHAVDGLFGANTHRAILAYQQKNKLKATGELDPATMAKMGIDAKGQPVKSAPAKKAVPAKKTASTSKAPTKKKEDELDFFETKTDEETPVGIQYKCVGVSGVKVLSTDEGVVEAIVSVTGLKDNVNDIIVPGAYAKTLAARTPKGVWHHSWTDPVSRTEEVQELLPGDPGLPKQLPNGEPWPAEAGALKVKTRFNLGTQRGRDAYSDVVFFGDQQEWSIGYNVPLGGADIDKNTGVRTIKQLDLYEYSPVLFGAMPVARTASVKDAQMAFKAINTASFDEFVTETKSFLTELENKAGKKKPQPGQVGADDESMMEDMKPGDEEDQGNMDPEDMMDGGADEATEDENGNPKRRMMRRGMKALTAPQAALVVDAIDSLKALLNALASGNDGEPPLEDTQQEKAVRGSMEHKTMEQLVSDLLPDADLADQAKMFDQAVKDGNEADMEAAATPILDEVQQQIDDGANQDDFEEITDTIVQAFDQVENGAEGGQDQSGDQTESDQSAGDAQAAAIKALGFIPDYEVNYQFKRQFTTDKRRELAASGNALPDGSYPIETMSDLEHAYQSWGRAAEADRGKVKDHLLKMAKKLKAGQDWIDKINALGTGGKSTSSATEKKTISLADFDMKELLAGL